jgi:hypothetical protein
VSPISWGALFAPILGLITALIGVGLTIRHNARINRANLFSNYRLKWMDLFREELSQLLILGERLYEPSLRADEPDRKLNSDLRACGKRLIILLGCEEGLRKDFAELVRGFAASPTAELSECLETSAQIIFEDAWDRGRADTGRPKPKPSPARARDTGEPGGAEAKD